ncbi:MAG: L-2-amino-thiazoline-4-carboxylic acid hydrolase [Deltaproteobacteria bacterium]|nr:L-2-amino-thiazoline-4-carboxylic acid hydrolase [Deltaproteobacteria bacterium]MBW1818185.1 L-2-amino-thiazoline-4-carboxylic acid hydrolase [Deltaproteobacteria bacterium]
MSENYYLKNQERFVREFNHDYRDAQNMLEALTDLQQAADIRRQAVEEFIKLLPDMPYIGGDRNPMTRWIVVAAHYIAFYRPMKAAGLSAEQCGRMMYDLYVQKLSEKSDEQWQKEGTYQTGPEYIDLMKRWAESSKNYKHLPGWVVRYVEGDGEEFDYGIDYHQCGCLLYFQSQGVEELAPYLCLGDFPEHKRLGTGLVRTRTLAMGDGVCNFRFKKGRDITQDWDTEAPTIKRSFGT